MANTIKKFISYIIKIDNKGKVPDNVVIIVIDIDAVW